MIKIDLISDIEEIRTYSEICRNLAKNAGCRTYSDILDLQILWYQHFRGKNRQSFEVLRGRNFIGRRSFLEQFTLLIAKRNGEVAGAVPLVTIETKVDSQRDALSILCFPGDPGLIQRHDFWVVDRLADEVIPALVNKLLGMLTGADLLYLQNIPNDSKYLVKIRDALDIQTDGSLEIIEAETVNAGGVRSWNAEIIRSALSRIQDCLLQDSDTAIDDQDRIMADVAVLLERITPQHMAFAGNRKKADALLQQLAERYRHVASIKTAIADIVGRTEVSPIRSPFIDLTGGHCGFMVSLGKKTRNNLKYYHRRFIREGGDYEKIDAETLDEASIQELLHLHSQQWKNGSASLNNQTWAFHHNAFDLYRRLGYLQLIFAVYRKKRIAALASTDIGGVRESIMTGRDPRYSRFSIGNALFWESIMDAIEKGIDRYELGAVELDYKKRLATGHTEMHNFICKRKDLPLEIDSLFWGFENIRVIKSRIAQEMLS